MSDSLRHYGLYVACQACLSMGFSRQEYPGIEPVSLMSPTLAGRFFTASSTWETNISPKTQMTEAETPLLYNKLWTNSWFSFTSTQLSTYCNPSMDNMLRCIKKAIFTISFEEIFCPHFTDTENLSLQQFR